MFARSYRRPGFVALCCVFLIVIGRNFYRRQVNEALYSAVKCDNLTDVKAALDRGADPDALTPEPDEASKTAWSRLGLDQSHRYLSMANAEPIAYMLIEHSAPSLQPQRATLLLPLVCGAGYVDVARRLLQLGADPNGINENGALDRAIQYRFGNRSANPERLHVSQQLVRLLLDHGAKMTTIDAVRLNDLGKLKALLDSGTPVNAVQNYHTTALSAAVETGNMDAVKLLLAHGADPIEGQNCLRIAISTHRSDIGRFLLARDANLNRHWDELKFGPPVGPLADAIRDAPDMVMDLLNHGADVNAYKGAALRQSILSDRADLMRTLLEHGADINIDHGAVLKTAISSGRTKFVTELLWRGANPDPAPPRVPKPLPNAHASSAVVFATVAPSSAVPMSGDIVVAPGTPQLTAHAVAAPTGRSTRDSIPDPHWMSPLETAVAERPEYFDLLLIAGADIERSRSRILLTAITHDRIALIPRLVAAGADTNAADALGNTVLMLALTRAPAYVQTLLEHGANPNAIRFDKRTPLNLAAESGDLAMIRLLLAHGAQVNGCPPRGHTALYYARKRRRLDIIAIIQQYGAK